jgi:hypothetical protein
MELITPIFLIPYFIVDITAGIPAAEFFGEFKLGGLFSIGVNGLISSPTLPPQTTNYL